MLNRRNTFLGLAMTGMAISSLGAGRASAQSATSGWVSGTEHLAMTLMGGTLAKQTSELAPERAQHPKVKQFAGFEIAEQTALAQVLTNTVDPPPVPLDAEHAAVLEGLRPLSGAAFDRAYVQAQIQGHEKLLRVQQGYLDNTARTPDTQNIAVLARMSIQQHLTLLRELQQMVAA
jgi:putative membrane protein